MENQVDGTGVVHHIEPVAHIDALAVNRQRLVVLDIVDEQRDQFLRKLVRTVVVGTVGDDRRQAVGVVVGTHEVVGRGLRRGVRTVRRVGRGLLERARVTKSAIHLIGGDVVEPLSFVIVLPDALGSIQQVDRPHHIGEDELHRIGDGTVHMRLGSQMDNAVKPFFFKKLVDERSIHDVTFHEVIIGFLVHIRQILQIAGIGQFIQIINLIIRIFVHKEAYHMTSYKAGAASDQDFFHLI